MRFLENDRLKDYLKFINQISLLNIYYDEIIHIRFTYFIISCICPTKA